MAFFLEVIGWIGCLSAVTGVILNNYRLIYCFPVFLLSNAVHLGLHLHYGVVSGLITRDALFLILAVHGWWQWSKKHKGDNQ